MPVLVHAAIGVGIALKDLPGLTICEPEVPGAG